MTKQNIPTQIENKVHQESAGLIKKQAQNYVANYISDTSYTAYKDGLGKITNTQFIDEEGLIPNPFWNLDILFSVGGQCEKAIDKADKANKNLGTVQTQSDDYPQRLTLDVAICKYTTSLSRRYFWFAVWETCYGEEFCMVRYNQLKDNFNNRDNNPVTTESFIDISSKVKVVTK